jgi:hypothetical protein
MNADGSEKRPITANRNNDRWPHIHPNNFLSFTSWSRNREVIAPDGRNLVPYEPAMASLTSPTNNWNILGLHEVMTFVFKPDFPVWRAKTLFNEYMVAMTALPKWSHVGGITAVNSQVAFPAGLPWPYFISHRDEWQPEDYSTRFRIVQMKGNLIAIAPSALPAFQPLPRQEPFKICIGPEKDHSEQPLSLATPNACPPAHIVAAGAVPNAHGEFKDYGLYLMMDDWSSSTGEAVSPEKADLKLLFNDPHFVDAEPVAVYSRKSGDFPQTPPFQRAHPPTSLSLASGEDYKGPMGFVGNIDLVTTLNTRAQGGKTDVGEGPLFAGPPVGLIREIHFYAAHRDRFDDTVIPRIHGDWELLMKVPIVNEREFQTWLPVGAPTVLVGVDENGNVASWTSKATDSQGAKAKVYAFAGDHYSGLRGGQSQHCIGCHPGHSGLFGTPHRETIP